MLSFDQVCGIASFMYISMANLGEILSIHHFPCSNTIISSDQFISTLVCLCGLMKGPNLGPFDLFLMLMRSLIFRILNITWKQRVKN